MNTSCLLSRLRYLLAAGLVLMSLSNVEAQAPAPPKEYEVQLRYRIFAGRTERLRQYYEMVRNLEAVGFKKRPGEATEAEDPSETRMSGTSASAQARKLLLDSRVKSLLLLPAGYQLPEEGLVKVHLELVSKLPPERQRLLAEQVRDKLAVLGFQENVGYDHRGHTRLVGRLPVGELETLLQDLRGEPSGWLMPATPLALLPSPLRTIAPLLVTEVVPEPEGVPPAREAPPPQQLEAHLQKITPDLRELMEKEDQPRRLEVILNFTPGDDDQGWRSLFENMLIEGRLGPLVTITASPKIAPALASVPIVSTVRLPRPARPQVSLPRGTKEGNLEALRAAGLMRLHTLGHRGRDVRVAIIDGDFRGYEQFVGKKQQPALPAETHYIDLTAERNANLEPDPFPGDPKTLGHGTELALAAALAAPQAEMILVRIDPSAPHQLQAVARYINGEPFRSESCEQRHIQLENEKNRLRLLREQLLLERERILGNFDMDEESVKKREAFFKKQADHDAAEKAYGKLLERFLQLRRDFQELKNVQIVSCALVWDEGLPLGGGSPLSRYFDDHPFRAALWFHSAGNTRGQTWSGLFRDDDGNGVMEFAPPGTPLRPERWTPELNFLAWQPYPPVPPLQKGRKEGGMTPDLPAALKLRVTIQWREAHDPEFYKQTEDVYRTPLAPLKLLVLRQRDPKGEKLAADEMEVVAGSEGLPQRLDHQPTFSVYEQALEFTVDPAGRYALRLEGRIPTGVRPPSAPTLPAMRQRSWELRPRIFADVVDDAFRKQGRAVFLDYPTDLGALGVPADARHVLTVGAADAEEKPQPYSTAGPAWNMELSLKPEVLSQDHLRLGPGEMGEAFGANQSAAFAAGLTAASFSSGTDRHYFLRALRERAGKPLRVP